MNDNELKGFPSPFVSPELKKNKAYGLQYVKAIYNSHNNSIDSYNERISNYIRLRKYAEGRQSTEKYKDQLNNNGDSSYLNLDYTPPPILSKFLDIKIGQMVDRRYKPIATAINPEAKVKQDEDRRRMFANMMLKPISEEIEKSTGIPLVPKNEYIPETDEEADLHFQLKYKLDFCMDMEEAIDLVLYNNKWKTIERKLIRDLLTLKFAAAKSYYDHNLDIRVRYIDPVNFIVPFSEDEEFKHIPYAGVIERITIHDLAQMNEDLTEEELFEIAKCYAGKNNNPAWNVNRQTYYKSNDIYGGREHDNYLVDVLDFEFISTNVAKWTETKKGNKTFVDKKGYDYSVPQETKFQKNLIEKRRKDRYEGKWVVGTDYLFGYQMSKNMPREKKGDVYSSDVELSFTIFAPNIYDMTNTSMVERMVSFEDQIALCHLKMQQVIIQLKPAGIAIDISGLEDTMKGMGKGNFKPTDITEMYSQTGNFIFSSQRADGSIINGRPIEQISNGVGGEVNALIALYQYNINMIRDVTGINEVADASTPQADALVGTSQLAIQQSNNATRELQMGFYDLVERIDKKLTLMIQDSVQNGKKIEGYYQALGEQSVKVIKASKGISLWEFGIKLELLPDDLDKAELNRILEIEVGSGALRSEDAIYIKELMKSNVKHASQVLILRKKKYRQERMQEAQANSEAQTQSAIQASQAKAEGDMQTLQMQTQSDIAKLTAEYGLKAKLEAELHGYKMEEIALQNSGKIKVAKEVHEGNIMHSAFENAIQPKPEAPVL